MEVIAASGRLKGDNRALQLIEYLEGIEDASAIIGGVIYYEFPLFRDADNILYKCQVLLASRSHGICAFAVPDMAPRDRTQAYLTRLDEDVSQLVSIVVAKLIKSKVLRRNTRELRAPVQGFLLLTDSAELRVPESGMESVAVQSLSRIEDWLERNKLSQPLTNDAWEELRSSLEGAKGLVRPKDRDLTAVAPDSKPALLSKLENEVANFDANQRRAAIQIVDGPQRIRGLAGSGKTIVLAMKAAHLHLSDPNALIVVTFYTKSLYSFLKRLITRFYRQFNDRDPDWSKIHIRHAWGGNTTPGVYYDACVAADIAPLTFSSAGREGFEGACRALLSTGKVAQHYDYVLIDEAQDIPSSFFQLCFALTRGGPHDRSIVWAYDELQNIMNVQVKSPAETFGLDKAGSPRIDLERARKGSPYGERDIVLHKCYRNPLEVLVTAHALGFGLYSSQPVQMLENVGHWEDVGYEVVEGTCKPGERTVIRRPAKNSPLSISETQSPAEIITWFRAAGLREEVKYVAEAIKKLMAEGLRADDIIVVVLDDRNARSYMQEIGDLLVEAGIKVNNMLADPYSTPSFMVNDHVTLTTVYRAKGNEAAVVFAVGIDALHEARKLQGGRNKLFTAFTRAKAWLRVSGVGEEADFFFHELQVAVRNLPNLVFTYPSPATIVTLQRDLSDRASKMQKLQKQVEDQLEILGLNDLSAEDTQQLVSSLTRRKK